MSNLNDQLYKKIRDLGYKPRIIHYRRVKYFDVACVDIAAIRRDGNQSEIVAKGGSTVCRLENPHGTTLFITNKEGFTTSAIGEATCSPKDNYNRKIGVQIAFARALEYLNGSH
jgi:hypothetical protein